MGKKKILIPLAVIAIVLIIVFTPHIIRLYESNIVFIEPDSYCFYTGSEVEHEEYDLQTIFIDKSRTYHIETQEKYISPKGSYVYVTGHYYNSLSDPSVYVNGDKVDVLARNEVYHFYIYDVTPEQKYNIIVTCGTEAKSIDVIFHGV
jgi:hypothetical protein